MRPNGVRVSVRARHYVLAGGAINTPALLLRSHDAPKDALTRGMDKAFGWLFRGFNKLFHRGSESYSGGVKNVIGRKALMLRGDNEVGPYQSPMEDGMQHFHEWYRRVMAFKD